MKLKIWFMETRPQFLVLSIALVLLGTSISVYEGYFDWLKFFLTMLGLLLAHTSVNVLNDYFDYKSGIDFNTTPTPFSGGSGILPKAFLNPNSVYIFGMACLGLAFLIGIYLTCISGWQLLPLILLGGGIIYFYTTHLTKWLVGELFAGLGLGCLPVLGTYFVQTGFYSAEAIAASLAPGFLTTNLLLLNEFPDAEADEKGGRHHFIIALGKKKASRVYAVLTVITYFCIICSVVLKLMPTMSLISLATIPPALKAITTTNKNYDSLPEITTAMKANITTVLGTDLLLALGYFLA